MTRLRPALIGVLFGLVLVGCGAQPEEDAAPPQSDPPAAASEKASTTAPAEAPDDASEAPPAENVPELLKFDAKTVDGEEFSGASLYGSPAVLWFWAPWCPNCQAEASTIAEVSKTDGVRFVGVAAQDQLPAMREFVDKYGLGSITHLADTSAEIWKRFDVTYQPAYAFVSADGKVEVQKEQLDADELTARVRALR